jgi:hypothetical protein
VSSESGIDLARLGRTLILIGFVTAVFLLLAVNRLDGDVLQVGIVGIGAIAFVTAIVGFLVAAVSAFEGEM